MNTDTAPATVGSALSPSAVPNFDGTVTIVNGNSEVQANPWCGATPWFGEVPWCGATDSENSDNSGLGSYFGLASRVLRGWARRQITRGDRGDQQTREERKP